MVAPWLTLLSETRRRLACPRRGLHLERLSPIAYRLPPGQAENPFGDDVALDLGGSSGDGPGEGLEMVQRPGLVVPATHRGCIAPFEVDAQRSERLAYLEGEPPARLAAEKLEHTVLGGLAAFRDLGESLVPEQLDCVRLDVRTGDRVAENGVVCESAPIVEGSGRRRHHLLDEALEPGRLVDPEHPSLVGEGSAGDGPPVVQFADEILLVHLDVREEDLVEVGMVPVGQLRQRTSIDSGSAHVDDENADARVLRSVEIGPYEAEAEVGVVSPGRPNLLTVDDELVADELGAGPQPGEVAPGVRARSSRDTS